MPDDGASIGVMPRVEHAEAEKSSSPYSLQQQTPSSWLSPSHVFIFE
jgi:hypothetical protein